MRRFNWNPTTCRELSKKLRRYVEVVNLYSHSIQNKDLWADFDKYEKYVEPILLDIYDYVESLGFTREEAEICFPIFYEPPTSKTAYKKYARNLSSIIYDLDEPLY